MAEILSIRELPRRVVNNDPENYQEDWTFLVEFAKSQDGTFYIDPSLDLWADSRIPSYFELHPTNPNLFVVDRQATQLEDAPQCYEVTITYKNNFANNSGFDRSGNQFQWVSDPLKRPAVIEWDTYQTREVFEMALDDSEDPDFTVPVATTAGEPLIIEEVVSRRLIHVQKNVQRINPLFATEMDFVNKDNVRIGSGGGILFPPRTLWLTNIRVSRLNVENNVPYYVMSFDLYHNPQTWDRKVRNMGFHEAKLVRDQNGDLARVMERIKLENGEFPSVPVPIISRQLLESGVLTSFGLPQAGQLNEALMQQMEGRALRLRKQDGMWAIACPETPGFRGLPSNFWKYNMLTFKTRREIKFTNNIPLK